MLNIDLIEAKLRRDQNPNGDERDSRIRGDIMEKEVRMLVANAER